MKFHEALEAMEQGRVCKGGNYYFRINPETNKLVVNPKLKLSFASWRPTCAGIESLMEYKWSLVEGGNRKCRFLYSGDRSCDNCPLLNFMQLIQGSEA